MLSFSNENRRLLVPPIDPGNAPGPITTEAVPHAGVTLTRDAFHVPYIRGVTHDDVTWGAGWVTEEDRGLLLQFGRGPAYAATVDPPGIDAFGLLTSLRSFTPSAQTQAFVSRETTLLRLSRMNTPLRPPFFFAW